MKRWVSGLAVGVSEGGLLMQQVLKRSRGGSLGKGAEDEGCNGMIQDLNDWDQAG